MVSYMLRFIHFAITNIVVQNAIKMQTKITVKLRHVNGMSIYSDVFAHKNVILLLESNIIFGKKFNYESKHEFFPVISLIIILYNHN